MDFQDTIPTESPADSRTLDDNAPPQTLAVAFTGSGSEYFRIWIVNLLLTIVTLTLYTPFARARRLSYFYANTRVGGHALGFHGDPWKMLRGYLLVAALGGAYAMALRLVPAAAGVAVLLFALVWPALWRASLQFRLANTSWRGLRFGFEGSTAQAYRAMAPLYLPAALMLAGASALPTPVEGEPLPDAGALLPLLGLLAALTPLLYPLSLAWMKCYQHDGLRYASEQARLPLGAGPFYLLALKTLLVGVLALAIGLGLAALLGGGLFAGGGRASPAAVVGFVLALGLVYLLVFCLVWPYFGARLQNLAWGATRSRRLGFTSELAFLPYAGLTARNLLLTTLTLGLYRPFAAVSAARMRLQAVTVQVKGDVDDWVARSQARQAGTTGDAAGDFFGIDLGL
jgi:uncharacterized membrane protein YjgN (DUF898 family)